MLSHYFNFSEYIWVTNYLTPKSFNSINKIDCGFAFIRNPINRMISAYYEIDKQF